MTEVSNDRSAEPSIQQGIEFFNLQKILITNLEQLEI